MSKLSLKESTAHLIQNTSDVLKHAGRLKKEADNLVFALDNIEKYYVQQENEKKEKLRLAEEKRIIDSHMTSYTMPDEEALTPAASVVEETAEETPVVNVESKKETPAKSVDGDKVAKKSDRPFEKREERSFEKRENRPYEPRNREPRESYSRDTRTGEQRAQGDNRRPQRDGVPADRRPQGNFSGDRPRPYDNRTQGIRPPFNKTDKPGFKPNMNAGFAGKDEEDDNRNKRKAPSTANKAKAKASDIVSALEKERVSNYDPNKKSYERRESDYEKNKKNKKIRTNHTYVDDDEAVVRGGRKAHSTKKKLSPQQLMQVNIEKAVMTTETITVRDLSAKIGKQANEILKKLFLIGVMATINSELDFDTASLAATELGVELEAKLEQSAEEKLMAIEVEDDESALEDRPPVITIMGHVDHGKTSLLDYIRNSHVTSGEAGGITQHIGAYMVRVNDKPITFLDTPGHEAFTSMRARGAQATDIAIIVVAANDGVMPQTKEAINHAKAAGVPIIIAINKMDLQHANPDKVKQELANLDLIPEEWGGETIMVPISAHTGMGIDTLLEMILLVAEVQQYKANPNKAARGIIIEAKLDKSRGPLATVLLKGGTLKIGDSIVAGTASGNVRAMLNDLGESVSIAGPSTPVEISGFDEVPEAGDEMFVVEDNRLAKSLVAERKAKEKEKKNSSSVKLSLDNLFSQIDQGQQVKLNIIIKADVQGSVEAVKQALEKLSTEEVKVAVLHSAVGAITNDDVNLASAFNAIIIGFNIRPNSNAKEIAAREGVDIRLYRVIYKAIEDIELAMKGMLEPEIEEVILGHAEVRDTFRITGVGTIAGAYVSDGKMQRNAKVRLLRDNVIIFEGKLSSLKRYKEDAKEVAHNFECGISLEGFNDIKIGDVIECFIEQEKER